MLSSALPEILIERLGEDAVRAVVDMVHESNRACTDDVLEKTSQRFERRLVEETSKLRVEMAQLRVDLHGEIVSIRGDLHREIVSSRFELIKWNFAFWVGQVVALAGVMSLMLRGR